MSLNSTGVLLRPAEQETSDDPDFPFPIQPGSRGTGRGLMLAACGGGDDGSSSPKVGALKVMGDSLADVGTFGLKFTIQGNRSIRS